MNRILRLTVARFSYNQAMACWELVCKCPLETQTIRFAEGSGNVLLRTDAQVPVIDVRQPYVDVSFSINVE